MTTWIPWTSVPLIEEATEPPESEPEPEPERARWRLLRFGSLALVAMLAGLGLFASPAAAQDLPLPPPWGDEALELEAAEALWAQENPGTYTYRYQTNCFCLFRGEVTVQILDGNVFSATDELGADVADPITISQMFEGIDAAIHQPAQSLMATYDPTYGYPTSYLINGVLAPVDGHFGLEVTSFDVGIDCCYPRPLVDIEAEVSCLNNDGRIDLTLTSRHPADGPIDFVLIVGTVERVVTLTSGEPRVETVTGRPDGFARIAVYELALPAPVDELPPVQTAVSVLCDPPVLPVQINQSCLLENGRIDVIITPDPFVIAIFPPPPPDQFVVTFGNLTPREVSVHPGGQAQRVTVTGRPDKSLRVVVAKNGVVVEDTFLTIACDPPLSDPIEVQVSCLAGNGRVDVFMDFDRLIPADASSLVSVSVGPIIREVILVPGINRVTVTGRPDGPTDVHVVTDVGDHLEVVVVSCDAPL